MKHSLPSRLPTLKKCSIADLYKLFIQISLIISGYFSRYRSPSKCQPGRRDWRAALWLSLYKAIQESTALNTVYHWIKYNKGSECGISKWDCQFLRTILKEFDNPEANRRVMAILLKEAMADVKCAETVAAMAWALGIPSIVHALLPKLDKKIPETRLHRLLKRFAVNLSDRSPNFFDRKSMISKLPQPYLVFVTSQSDLRVLYDIASCFENLVCVFEQVGMIEKARPFLNDKFEKIECYALRSNIPISSAFDFQIAKDCEDCSEGVIESLMQQLRNSGICKILKDYRPALGIGLEDKLYLRLTALESLRRFLADRDFSGVLVVDSGIQMPSYLKSALSIFLCRKMSVQRISSSQHDSCKTLDEELSNLGQSRGVNSAQKDTAQLITNKNFDKYLEGLLKEKRVLFQSPPGSVGIVANFDFRELKTAELLTSVVRNLLDTSHCLLLQRTPFRQEILDEIHKRLDLEIPSTKEFQFEYWKEIDNLASQARACVCGWSERILPQLLLDLEKSEAMHCRSKETEAALRYILIDCLDWFLEKEIPFAILLALCAEQSFKVSTVHSLLIVPEDRSMAARVFTIAAQKQGVRVFNHSFLFLSKYPRYKAPIADYLLVPTTFHSQYFQEVHGFPASRILLSGWHALDKSLEEARAHLRGIGNSGEQERETRAKIVLFASQPRFSHAISTALEWVLKACVGTSARVVVRPHPSEGACHDFYQRIFDRCEAGSFARLDEKTSLVEAILACDVCVTLFSNVGLEAAVLDRPVLTIKIGEDYPVDLEKMGIAIGCYSEAETQYALRELLFGGAGCDKSQVLRDAFFQKNPNLRSGLTAERIANAVGQPNFLLS